MVGAIQRQRPYDAFERDVIQAWTYRIARFDPTHVRRPNPNE